MYRSAAILTRVMRRHVGLLLCPCRAVESAPPARSPQSTFPTTPACHTAIGLPYLTPRQLLAVVHHALPSVRNNDVVRMESRYMGSPKRVHRRTWLCKPRAIPYRGMRNSWWPGFSLCPLRPTTAPWGAPGVAPPSAPIAHSTATGASTILSAASTAPAAATVSHPVPPDVRLPANHQPRRTTLFVCANGMHDAGRIPVRPPFGAGRAKCRESQSPPSLHWARHPSLRR